MRDGITRRAAAGAVIGGVVGGAALAKTGVAKGEGSRTMSGKIDTHQHYLPKIYLDAIGPDYLATMTPNHVAPQWSVEAALAMMDENDIAEGILSVSAGPKLADPVTLLRKCNDIGTDLRAKHPGRFGLFASLPLPHIDASLKEIAYSLDTLKADGFIIFSNYDGHYLGNPMFKPIWEELNRRKAVAFIHPTPPPYSLAEQPALGVLELPFETTRTATGLVMSGTLKAYPDIAFILSHAGGTLPFLQQRIMGALMMAPDAAERIGTIDEALRHFWYDTALSMSKPGMAALLAVADPARISFGTDFPFAPAFVAQMSARGLAASPMPDDLRAAIGRGNAARLLKRG